MNILADNRKLLLVYRSMLDTKLDEAVDIIVTPEFYTLKKETLPFKYAFQARRIAPSIFEGLLEEGKSYEYFVYKEDEFWIYIAYSMDEIISFLKTKKIDPALVSKLFFTQQFSQSFQMPYALNESKALSLIDDTVVILPKAMLEGEETSSAMDIAVKPKRGIMFDMVSDSPFGKTQALLLSALFLFIAILYTIEGSRYNIPSNGIKQEYLQLVSENPSLESRYKRESILKKYREIDSKERRKREIAKSLGMMNLKGVTMRSMTFDEKTFKAYLLVKDTQMLKKIETLAEDMKLQVSKSSNPFGIYLEGRI